MSLTKNSIIYLSANIATAAIPFLLLPVLTRALLPEEYGQVAMFQTLVAGLVAFVGLNTVGAANRKFYDHTNEKELAQYNGACIHILVISTIALLFICFLFSEPLSQFLSIPKSWLYVALIYSALSFVMNLRLGQWQIRSNAKKYGLMQLFYGVFNMVLSLIFVLYFEYGAQGRVDGQALAMISVAFVALISLFKEKLINVTLFRLTYIREALNFGLPLIPHFFGAFLLTTADRFVINQNLGLSQAGIYMVAVQISMAFNIIFNAINKAYVPWLFNILKENDSKKKKLVVKYTYIYFLFLLAFSPLPFVLGPWLMNLIAGEQYQEAGKVIGWLCLGQILGGMYLMVTNYIFFSKKTGKLSIVTLISGAINLLLLVYLVDIIGFVGAAIAFTVAKLFQFLFTWLLAYKAVDMPWFTIEIISDQKRNV
ncbi:oligosaccharide flippase family protein [Vibrio alginolyticus]|uniref:lipopolysaccharide biosynthesis protein n=1 Tax=Vibrio TaxID=662 RepID=UPI0008031D31|nr:MULTISPECIES: oligosaccharide flippase family protein [Vibrio]ANP66406.1 polysaccharide biosynthesis protein [Vibrio alginolyticus]MBS9901877.1 oligosaccharide flippase family protein [Vibrio alginolyticus]MCQ9037439.1 oligosaccharide flippase family protein [Vibrio alginolyticus]MDK9744109.1 oligosaccharide flippase family protein [Vibrio sp. B516a]MDW2022512.1 oligosaccharide flippase family protein [Vibrio sp. 397]